MSLLGSIIGGIGASHAARNIADQWYNAEQGVNQAVTGDITRADTGRQNYQPYINAGAAGTQALQNYALSNPQFSFDPSQYFNSPAYQFQLKEGTNAIQNNASAQGLGLSGNTLRDLTSFGQGLAANYYNQAFNQALGTFQTNQNTTLNNLSTLAGLGEFGTQGNQNAINAENALQLQGAGMAGNYAVGYGNAMANKTMAGYNAWGNIGSDILGGIGGYLTGGLTGLAQGIGKV